MGAHLLPLSLRLSLAPPHLSPVNQIVGDGVMQMNCHRQSVSSAM